jgi:hypothetical protein
MSLFIINADCTFLFFESIVNFSLSTLNFILSEKVSQNSIAIINFIISSFSSNDILFASSFNLLLSIFQSLSKNLFISSFSSSEAMA